MATARETGRVWLQNKMRQHSRDSFSACLGFGYTSKNNSQFSTAYGSLLGLALNSLSYICATGTFEVPRKGPSSKKIHTKIPQTDAQRPDCFKEEVKGPSCPVSRPEPTHRLLGRKQTLDTVDMVGKQSASCNDNSYMGASAGLLVVVLLCLNNIYPDGDTVLQRLELLAETTCSATKLRRKALHSHDETSRRKRIKGTP